MIDKLVGTKNGYQLYPSTSDSDLKGVLASYTLKNKIRCIIVNAQTRASFRNGLLGRNIFTVNNRVPNNCFYINHVS